MDEWKAEDYYKERQKSSGFDAATLIMCLIAAGMMLLMFMVR